MAADDLGHNTDWPISNTVAILIHLMPVLLGAFAGPAVLARELETGTFRYAWTQGIGRVRWTIAKLTLIGATLAILTGAVSQLYAWFFDPARNFEEMNVLAASVAVSRFWPMQFIEAGWLLALAIALGGATVWLVRHRAA